MKKERQRRAPKARKSRRRGGGRGAQGTERGGLWGGGVPLLPGDGAGEGTCSLPISMILDVNMVNFGAFWMVFFTVQLPVSHAKPELNRYRRIKAVVVTV